MHNRENFYKDIILVSDILKLRDDYFYSFDDKDFFTKILQDIDLPINKKNLFAIKQRICFLRDDLLLDALGDKNFDEILKSKRIVFNAISLMYEKKHQEVINEIQKQNLLTPFYRFIISRVHTIGTSMSKLALVWYEHIQKINKELEDDFTSEQNVLEYLQQNSLLDTDNGEPSDRSYSVLIKKDGVYKAFSYGDAFSIEVKEIISKIDTLLIDIQNYRDDIFSQDKEFTDYFRAIKKALSQTNVDLLINDYKQIDIKWMALTSPIQIGHPLEYYEDKYRKSVAIEWDIRLSLSSVVQDGIDKDIQNLASYIQNDCSIKYDNTYKSMTKNLSNIQLYVGRAMIYYGTSFNGMFSAQVVPNDENVSKIYGKKIFAFSEAILESIRARPFMKIDSKIFPKDFLDKSRKIVFEDEKKWNQIYSISTIGHEYGHILWCDETSESVMDKSGNFKNVEEFKATTGGLMAYFLKEDTLFEPLMIDVVKRAVKLLVYAKHEEIRPYYIESLIHLDILFSTKVLQWSREKLDINITKDTYMSVKKEYERVYKDLVYNFYLPKNDPIDFLKKYISMPKTNDDLYLPLSTKIKDFVLYYQELHKQIGSQIQEEL